MKYIYLFYFLLSRRVLHFSIYPFFCTPYITIRVGCVLLSNNPRVTHSLYIYIYTSIYICIYLYIYVYIYICTYIFIYIVGFMSVITPDRVNRFCFARNNSNPFFFFTSYLFYMYLYICLQDICISVYCVCVYVQALTICNPLSFKNIIVSCTALCWYNIFLYA